MKKLFFLTSLAVVMFMGFFILNDKAEAVYYASDTVHLYENNKQINYNGIYLVDYKTHSVKCTQGVCSIGQQFYPVTIHINKNFDILTYQEYSKQYPYEGDKYDGRAKDAKSTQLKEGYAEYLEKNTDLLVSFNPGPSEGGLSAPPGVIGGRIGTPRTYVLDISTGDYVESTKVNLGNARLPASTGFKIYIAVNIILTILFIVLLIKIQKTNNPATKKIFSSIGTLLLFLFLLLVIYAATIITVPNIFGGI